MGQGRGARRKGDRLVRGLGLEPRSRCLEVAEILEELRNGGTVSLGQFGDNGGDSTAADEQAVILDAFIQTLRTEPLRAAG